MPQDGPERAALARRQPVQLTEIELQNLEEDADATVFIGAEFNQRNPEFSPDGRWVASCGGNGWVRVWSVEGRGIVADLREEFLEVLDTVARESAQIENCLSAQREALEGCLEKLPDEQRTLVLAAYAPDVRIQDVAERSGRTVAAFYQWLHRMRVRLLECTRRILQAEGVS